MMGQTSKPPRSQLAIPGHVPLYPYRSLERGITHCEGCGVCEPRVDAARGVDEVQGNVDQGSEEQHEGWGRGLT